MGQSTPEPVHSKFGLDHVMTVDNVTTQIHIKSGTMANIFYSIYMLQLKSKTKNELHTTIYNILSIKIRFTVPVIKGSHRRVFSKFSAMVNLDVKDIFIFN